MPDFITELVRTFSEPTWRKFFAVAALLSVGLVSLLAYERYTASFRLTRLRSEIEMLSRIQELEGTNASSFILENARDALVVKIGRIIEESPISFEIVPSKFTFSVDTLWKFFAGGALLFMCAPYYLLKFNTREGRRGFIFTITAGALLGGLGMFLPQIWWPWFHIFVYPILISIMMAMALIAIVNFRAARLKAQQNTCVNNLRQLDGAISQWALENRKPDGAVPTEADIASYLTSGKIPTCPLKGKYQLKSVGRDPECTIPGHRLPPAN